MIKGKQEFRAERVGWLADSLQLQGEERERLIVEYSKLSFEALRVVEDLALQVRLTHKS